MKRICVLLVLCAAVFLAGCWMRGDSSAPQDQTPGPAAMAAGPALAQSTVRSPSDPVYFGQWRVEDYILAPVSALSIEDARAVLGQVISYGAGGASALGETCFDPVYTTETVSSQDFYESYRGRFTFGDVWLSGEEAEEVTVAGAAIPGSSFYLRDENSLVLAWDGAFFLARRAGVKLDESKVIQERSFYMQLNSWESVRFVSYLPTEGEDVVFLLARDGEIVYTFPAEDDSQQGLGLFGSVGSLAFQDVDKDGQTDVIAIINYLTGADPQGADPWSALRIYRCDGARFVLDGERMYEVTAHVGTDRITLGDVYKYFGLS